ncbi:MAG: class I SAM-dependent methyltransferase, partial [Saprospiraceae bacterium]|nr:class I SAM-dependent methyltransferase [Saprospiraceae bacterium]
MSSPVKITLRAGKEIPVLRFHPWVFSGAIAHIAGQPADGDIADVYDKKGNLLGTGHYHDGSIAVRLIAFGSADLTDPVFWQEKLGNALRARLFAGRFNGADSCYRLVHGEGDGLSGLVVDVYAHTAVVQCHSIGMHRQRFFITEALRRILGENLRAVYDKSVESLPAKYAETQKNGYLWSAGETPVDSAVVVENGARFRVDWVTGQKTGFFLDQRDNRQLLAQYAAGKSVLNAFCYTGGFSFHALKAGATL